MLRIIAGKCGTGKTTLLHTQIKALAESGTDCVVVVPDQYSFETERTLYHTVGKRNICKVNVTTPSKLAKKILTEYDITKNYADDIVKEVVMMRTLSELNGKLAFYEAMSKRRTFPTLMLSMISDMKNADVTAKKLRERLTGNPDIYGENLYDKLSDLLVIYESYNAELGKEFSDTLDDLRLAAELSAQHNVFEGKTIFFDGFSDFSGNQLLLVSEIIRQSKLCCITLPTDMSAEIAFFAVTSLAMRLKAVADESMAGYEQILLKTEYRRISREKIRPAPLIVEADDAASECDFIAADIRSKIISGRYRYKDILVVPADKAYTSALESAFDKYCVPYFSDMPQPVLAKPLVKFAVYALEAISQETDALLRYIKCGFVSVKREDGSYSPLRRTEIDRLEKIARENDISAAEWGEPFPDGSRLERDEPLRNAVISPLCKLKKAVTGTGGDKITAALCDFIINDMRVETTMFALCKEGNGTLGRDSLVIEKAVNDEYRQLWEILMTVFESFYAALKDFPINIHDYTKMLRSVLSKTNIAKPPQVMDAVIVGDMKRTRADKVRLMYLADCTESAFPPRSAMTEAFTASELETMCAEGITLKPNRKLRFSKDEFVAYQALEIPEDELVVTYPLISQSCRPVLRSPLVDDFIKNGAALVFAKDLPMEFYASSVQAAKFRLAKCGNQDSNEKKILLEVMKNEKEYLKKIEQTQQMQNKDRVYFTVSPELAEKLMKKETISPSALETLAECRFRYFCERGLEIRDENDSELGPLVTGNILHACLEKGLRKYRDNYDKFVALDDEQLLELAQHSLKAYKKEKLGGDFAKTARFNAAYNHLAKLAARLLRHASDEMKVCDFRPVEFERKVNCDFDGIVMAGKLDRLDTVEKNGKKYVKIVDYKLSEKKLTLEYIQSGLNLQMLLYLFAVCEDGEYKPSGAIYYPSTGKSNDDDRTHDDIKSNNFWLLQHNLSGIVVNDNAAAEEYEKISSLYVPEKAGDTKSFLNTAGISGEQYELLKKDCTEILKEEICRIYSGDIAAVPILKQAARGGKPINLSSCDYCNFAKICKNSDGLCAARSTNYSVSDETTEG